MYRGSQIEIGQLEPSLLDSDFVTRLSDFGMKLKVILNRSFMTGHFQTYRLTAEDESALNVRWRLLMKFLFGLRIKIIEGVWLKVWSFTLGVKIYPELLMNLVNEFALSNLLVVYPRYCILVCYILYCYRALIRVVRTFGHIGRPCPSNSDTFVKNLLGLNHIV